MGPAPDFDDGRFHPPAPPPIRFGDPVNAAALICVIGAPIAIVVLAIVGGGTLPWFIGTVLTLAFVIGFGTLILRGKPAADAGNSYDDGAVL